MKKEILVVDDDIITQNMLKTTVANAGYAPFSALGAWGEVEGTWPKPWYVITP